MDLRALRVLVLLVLSSACLAQDTTPLTAQPRIAPHLQECYRRRDIFERDNRLPMTPAMLIEIIRKVEDSPGFTLNLQQFTTSLLHRFKQDGIVPATSVAAQQDILPYNTHSFNFVKHRLLLSRLIQGNGNTFPAGVLTLEEQCTLHFMISTSIELQIRGDEGSRCNQLAQYRAARVPRDTGGEDVEMMKTPELANVRRRLHQKFGRYQEEEGEEQVAAEDEQAAEEEEEQTPETANDELGEEEMAEQGLIDVASNAVSACPVENGVLHSPWGGFSAGAALSGIAAGLVHQVVPVRDLIGNNLENYRLARQQQGTQVDNRFAATLSGDLAEAVLRQVPATVQVGASGAWNNSAVPRWYFLSQRERLEQTDAEIRGGIDGLVMASNILRWRDNAAQNLRLSQVLDMYYSQRGVFGSTTEENSVRACNRRNLVPAVAPEERLRAESIAFTTVLDGEMQTQITLNANSTARFAGQATTSLLNYISNTMNDLTCTATQTIPGDNTIWRAASDIYIFIDTSWPFMEIQSMIGHLLSNLDVGRFGTTYTILNANSGDVIVNTTNQLGDFYRTWNQSVHSNHPPGFNLPNVLTQMRNHSLNLMNHERQSVHVAGRSLIALVVPNMASVNEEHTRFADERLNLLREDVPDLRFIFWAGGTHTRFDRFAREPARDVYPLRIDLQGIGGDSIQTVAFPVIHRIQQEPRRIINHRCGADWRQEGQAGTAQSIQFVEPNGIVFYRLHPNYFFHNGDDRRVRIHGAGFSSITVCHSRQVERPRANATTNPNQQGEVTCRSVNADTIEINLWDACAGHGMIHHCPALFISVEGTRPAEGQPLRCTDTLCRFPDEARFEILVDNLGCFSSAGYVISLVWLIAVSVLVSLKF